MVLGFDSDLWLDNNEFYRAVMIEFNSRRENIIALLDKNKHNSNSIQNY
jgi:hypothetical protein